MAIRAAIRPGDRQAAAAPGYHEQGATMNIERIYRTAVPADDLARALADHLRAQGFETQVFRTTGDRTAMQARKESLWRQVLGVAYAMTVIITPGDGQLSITLGGHEWVDTAVSAGIALIAVPPVILGTAYGIWKQYSLDNEVWRVVDERLSVAPSAAPATTPGPSATTAK